MKIIQNFKNSFKSKSFKYGGYSATVIAFVIAILVILNMIVVKLDVKVDMTKQQMFSLSNETNKVLDSIKKPVNIYAFYESGKEDKIITTILQKYSARNKNITVEYKDPVKYPGFAQKYAQGGQQIQSGTIVVDNGSKFKVITSDQLVNYSQDGSSADSIAVEDKVTSAIVYLNSSKTVSLYTLKGHSESDLDSDVQAKLKDENYNIKDINFMLKDASISTNDVLAVVSPKSDLTTDEMNKIKDFLGKGGKAIFLMDIQKNQFPNFQSVLSTYGIGMSNSLVIEGDPSHSLQNPVYIVPDLGNQTILDPIKSNNLNILMPVSQYVESLKLKKDSTKIEPLLTTTKNSWAKKNLSSNTAEKESGDAQGPFNLAVAVTDTSVSYDKPTRLVVIGSSSFMQSQFNTATKNANVDFLNNCVNWTADVKSNITISPKSLRAEGLNMTAANQLVYAGLVIIVIPLIVVVSGVYVWTRRRHK